MVKYKVPLQQMPRCLDCETNSSDDKYHNDKQNETLGMKTPIRYDQLRLTTVTH